MLEHEGWVEIFRICAHQLHVLSYYGSLTAVLHISTGFTCKDIVAAGWRGIPQQKTMQLSFPSLRRWYTRAAHHDQILFPFLLPFGGSQLASSSNMSCFHAVKGSLGVDILPKGADQQCSAGSVLSVRHRIRCSQHSHRQRHHFGSGSVHCGGYCHYSDGPWDQSVHGLGPGRGRVNRLCHPHRILHGLLPPFGRYGECFDEQDSF